MHPFLLYNLKAGVCLALFYLFYKLLLSRETFHRFNRFVLLLSSLLAFVLPLCVITVEREVPATSLPYVELPTDALPILAETPPASVPAEPLPAPFPWERLAWALFLTGAAATLVWTLLSVGRIVRLVRRGRRIPLEGGRQLVLTRTKCTPFSWMRFVVLSERDYAESGPEILTHELTHIRLRHSCDLLLTDLAGCLQWFNPAMWLLRQELRAVHEYEADEAVLASGADAKRYQMLLIKKAAGERWYSVANSFNHSKLKNRITMMLQKKSSRWAGVRALYVLLLSGAALGAFARTVDVQIESEGTKISSSLQIVRSAADSLVVHSRTMSATASREGDDPTAVTGFVTCDGEPVEGASVMIAGTEKGVTTDRKGRFRIETGDKTVTLEISAPEYGEMRMTMQVRGGSVVVAALKSDRQKELEANLDPDQPLVVLDGKIVDNTSLGEIPSGASISISKDPTLTGRYGEQAKNGVISISTLKYAEGKPLYIVDGKVLTDADLALISPADIASMEVLKDSLMVRTYGDKARNGVVRITTKHSPEAKGTVISLMKPNGEIVSVMQSAAMTDGTVDKPKGKAVSVTTRTSGSLHDAGKTNTLIVIDGEIFTGDLNSIAPEQIESMVVLKDRNAVEQYGGQAKEGVIVISTRNPKRGLRYVGTEPLALSSSGKFIAGRGRFSIEAKECDPLTEVDGRIVGNGYLRRMDAERVLRIEELGSDHLASYGPAAAGHDRLLRITTLDHGNALYDELLRYGQELIRRSEMEAAADMPEDMPEKERETFQNLSRQRAARNVRNAADLLEKAHKLRPGDRRTLELLVEAATKAGEGSERIDRTYAKLAAKYRRLLEK